MIRFPAVALAVIAIGLLLLVACSAGSNSNAGSPNSATVLPVIQPAATVTASAPPLPTYPGKPGEIYTPTAYPTPVSTIAITPFPPDGDQEWASEYAGAQSG